MFETTRVYADCLDDEVDDLHKYLEWFEPKLTEYAFEIPRLRTEVDELRSVTSRQEAKMSVMGTELSNLRSVVKTHVHEG